MAQRDFDAERKGKKREQHTFKLGGHTFHARGNLPPRILLETTEESGFAAVVTFMKSLIVKEDHAAFEDLLNGDDDVDALEIMDVSNWLVEVISDRPTSEPGSSSTGPTPTTDTSGETASVTAITGKS